MCLTLFYMHAFMYYIPYTGPTYIGTYIRTYVRMYMGAGTETLGHMLQKNRTYVSEKDCKRNLLCFPPNLLCELSDVFLCEVSLLFHLGQLSVSSAQLINQHRLVNGELFGVRRARCSSTA